MSGSKKPGKVIEEVRWEFPNGLTGKAWSFYGTEELENALTDAGATVVVRPAGAPTQGPGAPAQSREISTQSAMTGKIYKG